MIDRLARAKQRHRERSIPSNTWERETDRHREREREHSYNTSDINLSDSAHYEIMNGTKFTSDVHLSDSAHTETVSSAKLTSDVQVILLKK